MRTLPSLGLLCTLIFTLASPPAIAEPELSPQFAACMDRSGGVTIAMIDCINIEHVKQDATLNANYRMLASKLTAPRRQQLLEAQRAWIRFRDLNCSFYADPDGGSAARVAASDCLLTVTAQRAQELSRLMSP